MPLIGKKNIENAGSVPFNIHQVTMFYKKQSILILSRDGTISKNENGYYITIPADMAQRWFSTYFSTEKALVRVDERGNANYLLLERYFDTYPKHSRAPSLDVQALYTTNINPRKDFPTKKDFEKWWEKNNIAAFINENS